MKFRKIVAEIDFNYDKDEAEFKTDDRVVRLNRFINEDEQEVLAVTFNLGRKEDDSVNLIFPYQEFRDKVTFLELES